MKKGYIYIVLTALLFSTIEVSGKLIGRALDPMQVTFLRFFIGSLILLPFALRDINKNNIKLSKEDFAFFLLTGVLCIPISMVLLQVSVLYTKASTAAVVFCTNPVFTVPFAYLILKEKIDKETIISIVFSFLGIVFIFNPVNKNFFQGKSDIMGMFIAILAAIVFALYAVISKKRLKRYGGNIYNCFTFLMGDFILLLLLLIFKKPVIKGINTSNISIVIYMGIFVTGLGYIFYLKAMEVTSALKVSSIFFIKPALAPLLSLIILKESIHINVIIGIVLIIFGSYINFKGKAKTSIS